MQTKKAHMVKISKYLYQVRYGTKSCYQILGVMPLCDAERVVKSFEKEN